RSRLRPAKMGTEASRAWRKECEKTNDHCDGPQAGRVASSPLDQRRSLPTVAQPPACHRGGCIAETEDQNESEAKCRVPVTASNAWPNFVFRDEVEVAKQVAAPAETRTPNLQRAKSSSTTAHGR